MRHYAVTIVRNGKHLIIGPYRNVNRAQADARRWGGVVYPLYSLRDGTTLMQDEAPKE